MPTSTDAQRGATPSPRRALDPRVVAALIAVALRVAVAVGSPAVPPGLDGAHYLRWAAEIAAGDLTGRGGVTAGEAWLFNPLYAYALAPLTLVFGATAAAVLVLQTALAAATAWMAADAARRFAGGVAAWSAGVAVAASAALVHLDVKVAVSGLAAFLVSGAVWSMAPAEPGEAARPGRGAFASGAWFGLGLLARPASLFALPFAAWCRVRAAGGRVAAILAFAVPVALAVGASFARNAFVAGDPAVFTAANGLNLHLGNNPEARRLRSMATREFRFGPEVMHQDAKWRVAADLGREPTRTEISAWFAERARRDAADAPAETARFAVEKLLLFAGPAELGSSEELALDRAVNPALLVAAVPTWLLAALAAGALVFGARRAELLLGPGAIVASHAVTCALVYPLSHYRSPAIPAMAVMAGVCAARTVEALRDRRTGRAAAAFVTAAAVAAAGLVAAPPPSFSGARRADEAAARLSAGATDEADAIAAEVLAADPDEVQALTVRLIAANAGSRFADAREHARRLVALRPWDPDAALDLAWSDFRLGRSEAALAAADAVVAKFPWSARVRSGRGALRIAAGDVAGGRADLVFARDHGFAPPPWALARAGL